MNVTVCDWRSRQGLVGDETPRGVVPAVIPKTVKRCQRQGFCSPGLPADPNVGQVSYIAPHDRGCSELSEQKLGTVDTHF